MTCALLIRNARVLCPGQPQVETSDIAVSDGKIAALGADMDAASALGVVDPDEGFVVRAAESESKQGYTPFEGQELSARVKKAYLRGKLIYDNGAIVGEPGGQYLSRPYSG